MSLMPCIPTPGPAPLLLERVARLGRDEAGLFLRHHARKRRAAWNIELAPGDKAALTPASSSPPECRISRGDLHLFVFSDRTVVIGRGSRAACRLLPLVLQIPVSVRLPGADRRVSFLLSPNPTGGALEGELRVGKVDGKGFISLPQAAQEHFGSLAGSEILHRLFIEADAWWSQMQLWKAQNGSAIPPSLLQTVPPDPDHPALARLSVILQDACDLMAFLRLRQEDISSLTLSLNPARPRQDSGAPELQFTSVAVMRRTARLPHLDENSKSNIPDLCRDLFSRHAGSPDRDLLKRFAPAWEIPGETSGAGRRSSLLSQTATMPISNHRLLRLQQRYPEFPAFA